MATLHQLEVHELFASQELLTTELQLILDCMSDGVIVSDASQSSVVTNVTTQRILGNVDTRYSPKAWLQRNRLFRIDRVTPFPLEEMPLGRALGGESTDHVDMYLQGENLPDGRYISVSGRPIVDDGEIVGAVAVLQDVSTRIEDQNHLQQLASDNERRANELNLILDCLSGGVMMADRDGRITKMNRAACTIIGEDCTDRLLKDWTAEYEILQLDRETPIPVEDLPLARAIQGEATSGIDLFLRRKGATEGVIIGVSGRPVSDDGTVIGGLITFQDITGKIEAAREREQIQLRMQEMQKLESVGRLAAGVAHEINTPIQYVCNNIDFMQQAAGEIIPLLRRCAGIMRNAVDAGVASEEMAAALETLESDDTTFLLDEIMPAIQQSLEGSHRVADIVQAMKEFSHPGTGFQETDINRAIESSILVARNEWKHAAEVELNLDPALPGIVCNPGEFNQVILNMVINSAHAIEELDIGTAGRIVITTASEPDGIVVRIADNGGGIAPDIEKRIFDPFFTTKGIGKGTGQGLAISHDVIINKHEGRIEVETELGAGTTFSIHLPHRPADTGAAIAT